MTGTRERCEVKVPKSSAELRATLSDLEAQIAASISESDDLEAGRGAISLRAHLGDLDAQQLLVSRDAELERVVRQRRGLESARAEATRELAAVEAREVDAKRRKNLRAAEKLTGEARSLAAKLDASIVACAEDARELERLLARAATLRGGNGGLTAERVERAVRSAFWSEGMKLGDHVPASWRKPIAEGLGVILEEAES